MPIPHFRRSLSALLLCLAAAACESPGDPAEVTPPPADTAALRVDRWRADLAHLTTELPTRHPNLFFQLAPTAWTSLSESIRVAIPELEDHEVVVRMMHMVAQVGDSHTTLHSAFARFGVYPFTIEWFDEGFFVVATPPENDELRGARVVRVGGLAVDSAYARVFPMIPHENEYGPRVLGARFLTTPEILHALGIAPAVNSAEWEFARSDGSRFTRTFTPVPGPQEQSWFHDVPDGAVPLYRQNPAAYYWHRYLEEERMLYVQINGGAEWPQLPFATFVQQVLGVLDTRPVDRMLVDLRDNTGGNMRIAWPLIDSIVTRPIDREGRLFVAIGHRTVSAGMINAVDFTGRTEATLIGLPTGGKPNSYMTASGIVTLPNSELYVRHSTGLFETTPGDESPTLMPEVIIPSKAALFFTGRDPIVEWVLAQPLPAASLRARGLVAKQ